MSLRLLLLMKIVVLLLASENAVNGDVKRSDNGTDLHLLVGKEIMIPEMEDETEKEREAEANKQPDTDVKPADKESEDKQEHDKNKGKNIESGTPPKYPLKAESAETSAHDNEIGGCRDHPRAGLVCSKCENGNKCFPAEHESYTYSYCRRSCRHCDPSTSSFHTFWRLRAQSEFEPTWMLQQVEFYADPQEKISLVDDPDKAYASSVYTGYKPSFGFDNNNSTAWYPSGWGNHDNNDDWIAYEFTVAVRVHGVRMVVDKDHATAQPKKVIVEASDKMYGPFTKKWTIYNTDYSVDKIYKLLECDVLWRRFEVEDGAWCFRLIAKLETWEGARKSCEIEGGDLATIVNKEEQRFVTDEVGLCSHTWFGLSHTNQGYYWNDGSNSTYRNWKDQLTYSDVQKQTLNCAAMDPDGVWFNFHCSNKFYFLCKKRLVPRPDPRPDLTDNAWPYPPEVPPLIFFAPNVTVPVINSKNLEPGIFPDANGKVEGEEEEDITLSDLFYEQTVEHLKEKGLKPSEEIEADENQEETDFTQELNKIAINTSPGDFQNETKGDTSANNTATAHKQEQDFENIPNKEANNAETAAASADAPKPKPKHKEKPVPPPPEEGDANADDNSYPEIKHGKPVEDSLKNKTRHGKKIPKGSSLSDVNAFMSLYPGQDMHMVHEAGHEQPQKAENIGKQNDGKKKKKPVHQNEEAGSHDNDKGQQGQQTSSLFNSSNQQAGMYFYVPNASGTFTLMRTVYPWSTNNNTGQQAHSGSTPDVKQQKQNGDSSSFQNEGNTFMPMYPGQNMQMTHENGREQPQKAENIGKQQNEGKKKKKPVNLSEEAGSHDLGKDQQGQQTSAFNSSYQQPGMHFYVPNASGTLTLMRTAYPWATSNYTGQQAQAGSTPDVKQKKEGETDEPEQTSSYMSLYPGQNMQMPDIAHEQPQKAENIGKQGEEKEKKPVLQSEENSSREEGTNQQGQQAPLFNSSYQQQGMYFYVPNTNGTYTLMRTVYPGATNNYATAGHPVPQNSNGKHPRKPPKPKEGDDDDDSEDSVEEPPDIKQKKRKGQSFKNKEIPMNPFTGPLGGPSLAQQNISKSARKKIKVLQPLESAAQGEDYSIMSESNKMKRKKVLSRGNIHTPQDKFRAKKKKRNRHLNHLKHIKEHDSIQNNVATNVGDCCSSAVDSKSSSTTSENTEDVSRKDTTYATPSNGFAKEEDGSEMEESGSGSGTQVEIDNADIFPETEEEFWSR